MSSPPLVHLQLVPADNIEAIYDGDAGSLLLRASGQHVDITRDISFHRLPFAGGLLFELQGWVGPVIRSETPYTITDSFSIDLPSPVLPSNTVVVNTANKQGWVVPIQYHGKSGSKQTRAASNGGSQFDIPEGKTVSANDKIVVSLNKDFNIKQADSSTGQGVNISIAFDNNFVVLKNASLIDGKIVWTLTAIQTGKTEVVVYVGHFNPPYIYRVVYDVEIVPHNKSVPTKTKALLSLDPSTYAKNSEQNTKDVGIPLSWDGFINVGVNLIKKQYPDARLYEVDATPLTRQPVDNEWGLVSNRIVCGLNNKTAIIQSTGWGEFGPVQLINSPWLGDVVIPWPVSMEIHKAFSILRAGGYTQAVEGVTLRQPLYPGDDQPFYIFKIGNEFIAVGVNDGKIYPFGVSERKIQGP